MLRKNNAFLASTAIVASLSLTACSIVPSAGPSAGAITSESSAELSGYNVVDVTNAIIKLIKSRSVSTLSSVFGDARKASSSRIGIGDTLSVFIWEAAEGGLFSAAAKSGAASIPEQPVAEDGTITVPYVGNIRVDGKTPEQVRTIIEKALEGKAIEPQVLVSVVNNVSNAVIVTGAVGRSSRVTLTPRGERVMDVIAMVGGPSEAPHQLSVQLTRGSITQSVPLELLISDPRENIYVQPDDIITLIRRPQSYTVIGATNKNQEVPFDRSRIFLNQALASVGGVDDDRANARGVFIYRTEPVDVAQALSPGKPVEARNGMAHVIYRFDLADPNTLFLIKDFEIYDHDLIYVANSSMNELKKFTTLIGTLTGPVTQGMSLTSKAQSLN